MGAGSRWPPRWRRGSGLRASAWLGVWSPVRRLASLPRTPDFGRPAYQYAHDVEEKVIDMQCLPDSLRDRVYYNPTNEGVEKRIRERLEEIKRIKRASSDRTKRES